MQKEKSTAITYEQISYHAFNILMASEDLGTAGIMAVWLYMKHEYPEKIVNFYDLAGRFNEYSSLEDWNEGLAYPYDSWEELAQDHTIIMFDGIFIIADECARFKWGLFVYYQEYNT